MSALIRHLARCGHAPRCCNGQPMTWDVFRAAYVCWACGASR